MYKIEPAQADEYMVFVPNMIESSKADYSALRLCKIEKLTCDGETVMMLGHRNIEFDEYPGKPFVLVCGVFSKDVNKHTRALLEHGYKYLDSIQKHPLIALAEKENVVYNNFLKKFGFVFTNYVEKFLGDGIVYNVYVRY
jgi:hypothetical protein